MKSLGSKVRGSYLYNFVLCSYQEVSVWKLKRGIRWCSTWKAKFSNVYMLRATSCFRSLHTLSMILPGMCSSRPLEAECCFTPGKSAMEQNQARMEQNRNRMEQNQGGMEQNQAGMEQN